MEAVNSPEDRRPTSPDDTLPTWAAWRVEGVGDGGIDERESCTRLASERPTVPPHADREDRGDVPVARIHLGPSVDEVLYRLSLGNLNGAALANAELEGCVPVLSAPTILVKAMRLTYLEEFVLASVDGMVTWGAILDGSPFSPRDTLQALCDLVDKGAITLT